MAQVNFNIPEELKEAYDKALIESGADNKPAFFEQMLKAFTAHQASNIDTDIDLSKYESVNAQTKEAMSNAFKHILTLLDGNLSTAKADALYIETEKKALQEKEEAFTAQLEKLRADTNSEILAIKAECQASVDEANSLVDTWKEKALDLESKNDELVKEFENISKVADQVEFISNENKELREKLSSLSDDHQKVIDDLHSEIDLLDAELVETKQSLFVSNVEKENKDKELSILRDLSEKDKSACLAAKVAADEKLSQVTSELEEVKGKFNQALGKLEILEKGEKK